MIGLGRAYAVPIYSSANPPTGGLSVSAQVDLFYVKPAADKICVVEAVYLGVSGAQANSGDAKEELLDVALLYLPATVTVGAGGNSVTPTPLLVNDTAASFTARTLDTTKATSSGTIVTRHADSWNSRVPYVYLPPPEHRDLVANTAAIVFRLNTTPAAALTVTGKMVVRELP
jgi:hypothetical protein